MGALAKIEYDKNASAAFTGCAPVDWVLKHAKDFGEWALKGAYDFVKPFTDEIGYFFKGTQEDLSNAWKWITNIPGMKQISDTAGAFIAFGKKAIGAAAGCIRTTLTGLGVAGAIGLAGGAIYLAVQGGLLASVATALTLGAFVRFGIRGIAKAYQFNWNISDQEIANRYKASINSLASQAGSFVGSGLAALACGGGGAAAVVAINPTAIALCEEVLEEVWDEVKGNATALVRSAWSATTQYFTLEIYRNARSAIKKAAQNPAIAKFLPEPVRKTIAYWGSPEAKPWSFASAIEEKIESIKPEWLKNFVEEAREEFADVCSEATYALSYGL